jgi:hypothetical protein
MHCSASGSLLCARGFHGGIIAVIVVDVGVCVCVCVCVVVVVVA